MIRKSEWANKWPSVDIDPYVHEDFETVMTHLAAYFNIPVPAAVKLGSVETITIADFLVRNVGVSAHMDHWTFSIATEREDVRDEIYEAMLSFPTRK